MDPSMMHPLARSVYENTKHISDKVYGCKGEITSYDFITKHASVKSLEPHIRGRRHFYNVPVINDSRGFQPRALTPGTRVWLSFERSEESPFIAAIYPDEVTKEKLKIHYGPQISKYMSFM